MENYIEKHKEKIQKTPGGNLCQVFGDKEGATCSIALVKMDRNNNGVKHYHDNITEIYLFSKGEGSIIINEHENIIANGDCYIIPPNNVHYIKSKTEMEFACICTPPWTENHEFIINEKADGSNILKNVQNGVIQTLSSKVEHDVKLYEINDFFEPNEHMKNYRRVYYFIAGNGIININHRDYKIESGYCYEVLEHSEEYINPNGKVKFVIVCDILK